MFYFGENWGEKNDDGAAWVFDGFLETAFTILQIY